MGWCGGTDLFDGALRIFLRYVPEADRERAVKEWYQIVAQEDWDTQDESDYFEEYLKKYMRE